MTALWPAAGVPLASESDMSGESGAAGRRCSGRGALCPAAAGEAPGRVCAACPSRPVRASSKGGWEGSKFVDRARREYIPRLGIPGCWTGIQVHAANEILAVQAA